MATLLLIGRGDALLEGLTQALASAGHRAYVARSLEEAEELAAASRPLIIVVERSMLADSDALNAGSLSFAAGGALILYREPGNVAAPVTLPHSLARLTLADLELPLERQRLIALAQYVEARAKESGRGQVDTPPEHRAL